VQALSSLITPQIDGTIRDLISRFDQIMMAINQMKNYGGGSRMGGQPYGNQMGGGRNWNPPVSAPYNPSMGRPMASTSYGSSGVFTSNNQNTNAPMGRSSGRFSNTVSDNNLQQPFTPIKVPEMTPMQTTEPVTEKAPPKEWKPSNKFPYFPAYNPLEWDLELVWINAEPGERTSSIVFPKLTKKKEHDMDYNRHGVNTIFGKLPESLKLPYDAEVVKLISDGLDELNGLPAGESLPKSPLVGAFVETKRDTVIETSFDAIWFTGMLERLASPSETIPYVFRMYGLMAEPFVSDVDENKFVYDLSTSQTFSELQQKLKDSVNKVSVPLWNACNRKATALINRILKQNMSLPDLSIDSFEADMIDLLKLMDKKYGATAFNWFIKNQISQIKATFEMLHDIEIVNNEAVIKDTSVTTGMAENYIDARNFPKGEEPKFTYLVSDCSFTYLNCTIHELDVQLASNVGSALTKEMTPIAFGLVTDLFKDVDDHRFRHMRNFDRHFIRTNDGVTMEACRGNIGNDWLILTLIDKAQ